MKKRKMVFDLQRFAVNEVRSHFINYEVFYGGTRKLGMADLTLPKINYKSNDITGAGIAGDVSMPTIGMTESMEAGIKWRTLNEDVTMLMQQKAHDLTFRGANQHYDAGLGTFKVQSIRVDLRGVPKGGNLGKMEQASESESENTLELLYLKITIDGVKRIEIDKLNYICYINGEDVLSDVRTALGV